MVSPLPLEPGTVLQSRYRIVRPLDAGGSATVYLAERLGVEGGVPLAVKELSPDTYSLAEFTNEVNALFALSHPNLPKVYDFFEQDGRHYLVMEFVGGRTLKERVLEEGPLGVDQVLDIALQVCGTMVYLHEQAERKVLHRDLKPSNLMLTPHGRVKLLDFGIARVQGVRPGSHLYAYTEEYASPEQRQGRGTDERSEVYSFGATLYFLLTGQTPHGGTTGLTATGTAGGAEAQADEAGSAGSRAGAHPSAGAPVGERAGSRTGPRAGSRAGLSREMRRVVWRCLRPNPADRYQSFREVARDLEAIRLARRTRTTRLILTLAGLAAALALAFAGRVALRPSLYPVIGPARVPAGQTVTLEAGLPAAWSGSLESIVWRVEDTQDPGDPREAGRGRYLSFSSTDLGVFQVQALVEQNGRQRPLTRVQRLEVYPALRVPGDLLAGQSLSFRCSPLSAGAGREYTFRWEVRGPVKDSVASAPVVLSRTTSEPTVTVPSLAPGRYVARVGATVKAARGLEVTVAGEDVFFNASSLVVVDPGRALNGNGSFESEFRSGPLEWSLVYPQHLAYDRAVGRTGTRSLRFEPWTGTPSSYAVQLVPLQPGRLYRLTVWVRGRDLGSGSAVTVEAAFRSAVDETYVLPQESVQVEWAGTFDWRQLMLHFYVPPGSPVNLEVHLGYHGSGTVWMDDCYVEALD